MRLRLSIAAKIALGFGTVTLLYLFNIFIVYQNLKKNQQAQTTLMDYQINALQQIEKLQNYVIHSRLLIKNWAYVEKQALTPDKLKLLEILDFEIPYIQKNIQKNYHTWPEEEQLIYKKIEELINDSLISNYREIIKIFDNSEAYNDTEKIKIAQDKLNEKGELLWLSNRVESKLMILAGIMQDRINSTRNILNTTIYKANSFILIFTTILIILAILIAIITIRIQIVPLNYIKKVLIQIGKGILPNEKLRERNDELGEIAAAVNSLVKGLKDISNFSIEIGKGNFNCPFQPLSENDILGNSLIKMREELHNATLEEEKRKKEDEQRNWSTQGIAKFSEILRQNNNDLSELSTNIISNLVNYLGANQGGIFIKEENDEEVILKLYACYAYDRKKFLEKAFNPGEGLVGRCYLEKQTIFLTEIPSNYIKITSGMGEAIPTCLLLVPLMHNDIVYGVVELASFNVFEPYQIDFVERIATSIASTISIVNINIQTTRLLEQSRKQAEEILGQEANLRKTIEELRADLDETERILKKNQKENQELRERLKKYEL